MRLGVHMNEGARLIENIRNSIIGDDVVMDGPFGPRRVICRLYGIWAFSSVYRRVYPRRSPSYVCQYAYRASGTGLQTGRFREDARDIILDAVGGTDEDVLIFCGSGATGAINKAS